jgi:hypothetical protein
MDIYDPIGEALGLTPMHQSSYTKIFTPFESIIGIGAFAGKHHTEESKKLISDANKGKLLGNKNPSKRPEVKEKLALPRKKWGKPKIQKLPLKKRTYEEIYGVEKAKELKVIRSKRNGIKITNFKKPEKIICNHCNKLYDPGNLKRHMQRITTIQVESD